MIALRLPSRFAAPFAALCASLALSACAGGDSGETHVAIIEGGGADAIEAASAQGLVKFDARGQILPALAERWHVSDDGRSYIFRLGGGDWPDGSPIEAEDVASAMRDRLDDDPLLGALGGIDEVVAMTDRVIEIRLVAPRPYLLPLLANPALAIRHDGQGGGPFALADAAGEDADEDTVHLERTQYNAYDEETGRERVHLEQLAADEAIAAFVGGEVELVLGGTFATLPLVREAAIPRGALRYDPVAGLFGLAPTGSRAPFDQPAVRDLLSRTIDREALIEALGVPALVPRATILQDGLDLPLPPQQPAWLGNREAILEDALATWRGLDIAPADDEPLVVRIAVADGPGGDILLSRLSDDWAPLGLTVQRAEESDADFLFVDTVAPSPSAAWFLRRFSCARARVCDEDIDLLVEAARTAPVIAQRHAILRDAGARMDAASLFVPLAAPIRWSLVAPSVTGFAENRYAFHPLTGLKAPLPPEIAR